MSLVAWGELAELNLQPPVLSTVEWREVTKNSSPPVSLLEFSDLECGQVPVRCPLPCR